MKMDKNTEQEFEDIEIQLQSEFEKLKKIIEYLSGLGIELSKIKNNNHQIESEWNILKNEIHKNLSEIQERNKLEINLFEKNYSDTLHSITEKIKSLESFEDKLYEILKKQTIIDEILEEIKTTDKQKSDRDEILFHIERKIKHQETINIILLIMLVVAIFISLANLLFSK
ncbi:MAG: hypothetical protein RMJ97_06250 [Raineya sp.]|nr:hypothetical protein [Raineya sp.]MDW8296474.1 hypothetical protein [Raineya sp.]